MHLDVLTENQKSLLPFLYGFKDFYLAGGTALALQMGHRKSIDFDLFQNAEIESIAIKKKLAKSRLSPDAVLVDSVDELTMTVKEIKITFLYYPYEIDTICSDESDLNLAVELDIGAMKAYAIGRRAKWKDYVDMYFLIKKYGLNQIVKRCNQIFSTMFNDRNFLEQLCFFEDIDYTEKVEYIGTEVLDLEIKKFLINAAKSVI